MTTTRLVTLLAIFVSLASLAGCSRQDRSSAPPPAASVADGVDIGAAPPSAAAGADVGAARPSVDRSLVVTMDVAVTVDRVDEAASRLRAAAERAGGFVADQRASGRGREQRARLELRVPAGAASAIRATLGELGEVTSATEKVEDVTEQRADLEARLRNARVQEKRLLEIMSARTASIPDLVEAERELARVREGVERLEAQERVIRSRVDLATLHVELSTKATAAWQTPGPSLAQAGREGVRAAVALYVYAGMAFVTVAPTLAPIGVALTVLVLLVRRRRAQALAALAG